LRGQIGIAKGKRAKIKGIELSSGSPYNCIVTLEGKNMAKKVSVNKDVCIGCGLCVGSVPAVFEFGDDGKAQAIAGAAVDASVEEAVKNCPVGAIEAK
jgi:ferredoxin